MTHRLGISLFFAGGNADIDSRAVMYVIVLANIIKHRRDVVHIDTHHFSGLVKCVVFVTQFDVESICAVVLSIIVIVSVESYGLVKSRPSPLVVVDFFYKVISNCGILKASFRPGTIISDKSILGNGY